MCLSLLLAYPVVAAKTAKKQGSSVSSTQDQLDLSKEIGTVNGLGAQATQPQLQKTLVESVAKEADVAGNKIKQDKQKTTLGYGDLLVAEAIAQSAQSTFEAIHAEHATKSWPESAQAHNVALKTLITKLKAVEKDLEKEQKDLAKEQQKEQQAQAAQQRQQQQQQADNRRHRRRN